MNIITLGQKAYGFVTSLPTPWKVLAGAGLALALLGTVSYKSYELGKTKGDLIVAQYQTKLLQKDDTIKAQVLRINDLATQKLDVKVDTIHQKVTKYVDQIREVPGPIVQVHDTVERIVLPYGMLSLYNASASNRDADSAFIVDATPSDLAVNDAFRLIVQNTGRCQETAARLNALQQWIKETTKIIDSPGKK